MMPAKETIPKPVLSFLIKASVLFVAWKLIFHLVLQPKQWPDAPMVKAIAQQTTWILNTIKGGNDYSYKVANKKHAIRESQDLVYYEGTSGYIYNKGEPVLLIVPNCNGLELMMLFAGFIICFPGQLSRKLIIIPTGIAIIHFTNILRSAALVSMSTGPLRTYFHFAHHYLFTITIYIVVFLIWTWYIKTEQKVSKQIND